jgi:two-component system chemotaxis response regulator CheY
MNTLPHATPLAAHLDKTLLIVDDSYSLRHMVRMSLGAAGYRVLEAEDGQAALDLLGRECVDLVISDLHMPRLDGLGLLRAIRAHARCKFLPVILLTTEQDPEFKQEGRAAGARAWMTKPFAPELLLSVVQKVLL